MTTPAHTPPGPDNQTVRQHLLDCAARHPDRASVQTILHTNENRPIDAITLTDPQFPDDDKQHVLIVAGQHGNEETARLCALATIDWLVSDEGRETLQKQKIVVLPNLSPDAASRDAYDTPAGVRPNLDHAATGPVSNEARALEIVAKELMPEAYVDIHAKGHVGCSFDMVLFPKARQYLEDESFQYQIAHRMAGEGEKSGIPHTVHTLAWSGWGGDDPDEPSSTLWMYRNFKSLVFLTETSESNTLNNPESMVRQAGIGRMKALFEFGNSHHPWLPYAGYPCQLATGMFHAGVVAAGATAADRRKSRIAIWKNTGSFKKLGIEIPEKYSCKTLRVDYQGEALNTPVGFLIRVSGHQKLVAVKINGKEIVNGSDHSWRGWQDPHTTMAVVELPGLSPGVHQIEYRFES